MVLTTRVELARPSKALDLNSVRVPEEFLKRIPLRFTREHLVIAIGKQDTPQGSAFEIAIAELLSMREG